MARRPVLVARQPGDFKGQSPLPSAGFRKCQALCGKVRPGCSPSAEIVVHHVNQLVERALVGKRIPPVAVVERQAITAAAERGQAEAWIGTRFVNSAQDQVTAPLFDRQTACDLACIEQSLKSWHDRRQPEGICAALG